MFRSCYGLSFNPFDKQNAREKDRFLSKGISEMTSRLDYLKDTFWNEGKIGSLMRKVDAVTVAAGLVHLPALASRQLKN